MKVEPITERVVKNVGATLTLDLKELGTLRDALWTANVQHTGVLGPLLAEIQKVINDEQKEPIKPLSFSPGDRVEPDGSKVYRDSQGDYWKYIVANDFAGWAWAEDLTPYKWTGSYDWDDFNLDDGFFPWVEVV